MINTLHVQEHCVNDFGMLIGGEVIFSKLAPKYGANKSGFDGFHNKICSYSLFIISWRSERRTNQSRHDMLSSRKSNYGESWFRSVHHTPFEPSYWQQVRLSLCHPLLRWLHIGLISRPILFHNSMIFHLVPMIHLKSIWNSICR